MEGEIWKPILGYEGLYEISNFGRVKSLSREIIRSNSSFISKSKVLRQNIIDGRCIVMLYINKFRKNHKVHILVAAEFISNRVNGMEVNHIDGNPMNNHVSNLEWMTPINNKRHSIYVLGRIPKSGSRSNLCKLVSAYDISGNLVINGMAMRELQRAGYCRDAIRKCCNGVRDVYRNMKWEFVSR